MTDTPKYGQAEALVRASVGQWLTKASKAAMDDTKPSLLEHMRPGGKLHAYVGGLDVGTVSVTDPKPREVLKSPTRRHSPPGSRRTTLTPWSRRSPRGSQPPRT